MFNLLISADEEAWERPQFVLETSRFLEGTTDELRSQFKALDAGAKTSLMAIPTLFAYETMVGKPARIGFIRSIQSSGRDLRISFELDPQIDPIESESVQGFLEVNGVANFARNHTHWAVKPGDLLSGLRAMGATKAAKVTAPSRQMAVALSRQTLMSASDVLQGLGHTSFDAFLLEIGVEGLSAGRDVGGLSGRAKAVGQFVVQNRGALTRDGEPLELAIVRKAAELDPEIPDGFLHNVPPRAREAFWKGLAKDGFTVRDGEVLRGAAPAGARPGESAPKPTHGGDPEPNGEGRAGASASPAPSAISSSAAPPPKVFLVHGRDDGAKYEVAHYLLRLGLDPVILHEKANGGRTLITKFREEADGAAFAVVLMTPDDVGSLREAGSTEPRARQNVVFELAYFIGKLGPERVCALVSPGVARPSDFEGVVYVQFSRESPWRNDLAREMHAAGIPFDPTRVYA